MAVQATKIGVSSHLRRVWILSMWQRSDQNAGTCMLQFRARQISGTAVFTTTCTGSSNQFPATRVVWLKRPRGISYEQALRGIIDGSKGFLSCWRKQMVLGPSDEFAIIGNSSLEVSVPPGWQARTVERRLLEPVLYRNAPSP